MASIPPLKIPALPKISLPSRAVLITGAILFASIYIVWWLILFVMFDAEMVEKKTLAALQQHLNTKVEYSGDPYFTLTPLPRLTLQNVQVQNDPRAQQRSFLQVPKMVVTVHPLSIISSDLYVQLEMFSPHIEMETFRDGTNSWNPNSEMPNDMATSDAALIASFQLHKAGLHYVYPAVNRDITLENIDASLSFPDENTMEASGVMQLVQAYYQFTLKMNDLRSNQAGVDFRVTDNVSTLSLAGKWTGSQRSLVGKQHFETLDLGHFFTNFLQRDAVTENPLPDQEKFPLNVVSDMHYQDNLLTLENVEVKGAQAEGKGEVKAQLSSLVNIHSRFDFDHLYLDKLIARNVFDHFISKSAQIDEGMRGALPEMAENGKTVLPQGVTVALIVTSAKSQVMGMETANLQLSAKMENAKIELPQFSGVLPGQTQFLMKGAIEGGFEGLALKGQLDLAGQEFREFFKAVSGGRLSFPESYERFRGRANVFANSSITRMSEGILRVEEAQLLGTLIRHNKHASTNGTDTQVAYEGVFRVDNADLNQLMDAQPDAQIPGMEDYPKILRLARKFTEGLGEEVYDLKFSLMDYMLNGQKRPNAMFELGLNENNFNLSNIKVSYNGTYIAGDMAWRFAENTLPYLQAKLSADMMDSAEFFGADALEQEDFWKDANGQWSKKEFDFDWLRKFNADFELTLGSLNHKVYHYRDLYLKGDLRDSVLELRDFKTLIWQGLLKGNVGLRVAKLPSFHGKFTYNGMRIDDIHDITDFFDDVSGRMSIDGDITSTGVNVYSVMQNMQGLFSLGAVGLTVNGFNLANMVRAANTVRTVSDIEKLVAYANRGGETLIQRLQGSVNLANGFMRTPGLQIATKVGNGTIKGQMSIMDWASEITITVYLTALQENLPPSIRLVFDGPINNTRRKLDTQSLESFIAKQAAERLLDTR